MADFTNVRVVWRNAGKEKAWIVEINPDVPLPELIPELVETLGLGGSPDEYQIHNEGSINNPVIVLTARRPKAVGRAQEASSS